MITPNGLITLKRMNGKIDSDKYIAMLQSFAVPIMNLNMEPRYYFIQDNAPVHVSQKTKKYFETQPFRCLEWPARSPDLNLMENAWKMISDLVYKDKQPQNTNELEAKISEAVLHINNNKTDITRRLFATFSERLTKLLICKGNILN